MEILTQQRLRKPDHFFFPFSTSHNHYKLSMETLTKQHIKKVWSNVSVSTSWYRGSLVILSLSSYVTHGNTSTYDSLIFFFFSTSNSHYKLTKLSMKTVTQQSLPKPYQIFVSRSRRGRKVSSNYITLAS